MIRQLFQTRLITTTDQFADCRSRWNELAGERLFHRWEWMYNWWRAFGHQGQLAIVVIVDGNGRWIGLAPWYKTTCLGQGRVIKQLASGAACSDYSSLAIRPGFENIAGRVMAEVISGALHREQFADVDLYEFEGHVQDDPAIAAIGESLTGGIARLASSEFAGTWRSPLPELWEDYESRLHRSFRRKTRRASRHLGQPEFRARVLRDPSAIAEAWPIMVELHQQRRESCGDKGCFADPHFERFLVTATTDLAACGRAQINLLEYLGRPLAANLEFTTADSVLMYQTGFDPRYLELEPGHITFTWAIQSAIRRKFKYFDFLRGDEPYKARWKSERLPLYRTRVVPNRLRARLRHRVCDTGRQMRTWSRRVWAASPNPGATS